MVAHRCHSYFIRPLTDSEKEKLRNACIEDIQSEYGLCHRVMFNDYLLRLIEESAKTDKSFKDPAMPNKRLHWSQFGFGEETLDCIKREPDILSDDDCFMGDGLITQSVRVHDKKHKKCKIELYAHIRLSDIAMIKPVYEPKLIHNKHQLRRFLRKDYFKLSDKDHELLSLFWKTFPKGIMYFS